MIKINSILEVTGIDEKRKRWVLQDIHIISSGTVILIGRRVNKRGKIIDRLNRSSFNYITDGKMMWDSEEIDG